MLFADLRLAEPILRAVSYPTASPIQAQAIPHVLEGRDVLGCAQTGTGKTAAFALPMLHRLSRSARPAGKPRARALVLCPTRELTTQIADCFREYGRHLDLRSTVIFGGVGENPQIAALRRGVDIIIATPGRLLDLMRQGHVDLSMIEMLVLDEADRMLDMGFIHDIRQIVQKLSAGRQTLLFSATMPREIRQLASSLLRQPAIVEVTPPSTTVEAIDQSVYFVERQTKPALLAHLVRDLPMHRTIVFTRTKHGADRVVRHLDRFGIRSVAIHGNKSQNVRQRALDDFRRNKTQVLIATDIASRGIDVDGITHVVNYDLTHEPETYVHRIGRTARAGATGAAIAFCDHEEVVNLRAIEKLIRRSIPVKEHQMHKTAASVAAKANANAQQESHPVQGEPVQRQPHPIEKRRPMHAPQAHRPNHQPHGKRPHGNAPQGDRPQRAADRPNSNGNQPRGNGNHRPNRPSAHQQQSTSRRPRSFHPMGGKRSGGGRRFSKPGR